MSQSLKGRRIVVTGGMGGLGQAVVAALAAAGALVHVPQRRPHPVPDLPGLRVVDGVDLTDQRAVDDFYAALPDLWASVHLAGGFAMAPIAAADAAAFQQQIAINAQSCFLCCRAAIVAMRRTGAGGRIVNVAARPALEPRKGAGMAAYAAAKAAVAALTQALAEEVKAEHILINAIAPSTIDTPANRAAMPKADPGRWLAPADAAAAILQLIAPENREISGAIIPLYARA